MCKTAYLTKDDALADGEELVEGDEDIVFMLFVSAVHVELPYAIDRELFLLQLNFVRIWRKLVREQTDVVGEGRREQDNLHGVRAGEHAAPQNASASPHSHNAHPLV